MRVLFVKEVLGLSRLNYYLHKENINAHKDYLLELLEAGYLNDISEVFPNEEDKALMRNSEAVLETNGNMYIYPCAWDEMGKKMRTEKKGIEIIEKYNKFLNDPIVLQFKEIENKDYERVIIVEWEDGSEDILFKD